MNWLDRLRHKRDPVEEREQREMAQVRRDFNHAAKRALKLEAGLQAELRRLESAPWKR